MIDDQSGGEVSVALTAKGALAVFAHMDKFEESGSLDIYDNFIDMREDTDERGYQRWADNILAEVASNLGEDYEIELDI